MRYLSAVVGRECLPKRRSARRATMELHNGIRYEGIGPRGSVELGNGADRVANRGESALIGRQRPKIFIEDRSFYFWGGFREYRWRSVRRFTLPWITRRSSVFRYACCNAGTCQWNC